MDNRQPFNLKPIISIPSNMIWEELGREVLIANLSKKPYYLTEIRFAYSAYKEKYARLILDKLGCTAITFKKDVHSREFHHCLTFVNVHDDLVYVEFTLSFVEISIFSERPDIKSVYQGIFEELGDIFKPEPTRVEIEWRCFLNPDGGGPFRMTLSMARDYDSEIPLENYDDTTRDDLLKLEETLVFDQNNGKIVILEGPPGTGKSYYVRRLVNRLYQAGVANDVLYFLGRGIGALELHHCLARRVLLMEDADHILTSGGNRTDDIAKILNFSSGFVETSALFIFTSNLPVSEIDPAFVRDGRLLAHIRFNCFGRNAAAGWLRRNDTAAELNENEYSLAKLYALSKRSVKIQNGSRKKAMGFRVERSYRD